MKRTISMLAIALALTTSGFAQQQVSTGELQTILKCLYHGKLNLLGEEFVHGRVRVRYIWARDDAKRNPSRSNVLFFAFRSDDGKAGRIMEFVPEGRRPKRHFTMVNDANFDGKAWTITSDPLGGVGTHRFFPAQLAKLRNKQAELRLTLTGKRATEGTCDSYVEPDLSR